MILKEFAFHNFWSTICEQDTPSDELKLHTSKIILQNEEPIKKYAKRLTDATMDIITNQQPSLLLPAGYDSLFLSFFTSCIQWNAKMIQSNPRLELLPRNQIPRKGTPLNKVVGMHFDFDFEGNQITLFLSFYQFNHH